MLLQVFPGSKVVLRVLLFGQEHQKYRLIDGRRNIYWEKAGVQPFVGRGQDGVLVARVVEERYVKDNRRALHKITENGPLVPISDREQRTCCGELARAVLKVDDDRSCCHSLFSCSRASCTSSRDCMNVQKRYG